MAAVHGKPENPGKTVSLLLIITVNIILYIDLP